MKSNIFKYQIHFDSIRAIAVIFVLLYHLNKDVFSFGYIGVDIFFVISGYVITQTLIKQFYINRRIHILEFYIKRLLRLFPTLLTVILTTFFVYCLITPYGDFEYISTFKNAFYSIFGLGNFFFFLNLSQFNYFSITDSSIPLIHTWSLGVEEQFYFIFPFLIIISFWTLKMFKKKIENFYLVIFFLIIVSFLFFATNHSFWSHFYLPFSRAWEILFGSLIFFIKEKNITNFKNSRISFIFFLTIISLLIVIFLLLNQKFNYKFLIILSVSSTLLLIYFYKNNNYLKKILENPIPIYIGKASYSIYLWHMPIIFFSNLYFNNFIFYISSILFTFLFSFLTYRFVEPLRYNLILRKFLFFFSKKIFILLIIGLSAYVYINNINLRTKLHHIIFYTEKKLNNFNLTKNTLEYRMAMRGEINNDSCNKNFEKFIYVDYLNCIKHKNNNNFFYLAGDSYAKSFVNIFSNSKNIENLYLGRVDSSYFGKDRTSKTGNFTLNNFHSLSKNYKGSKFFILSLSYPNDLNRIKIENMINKLEGSNIIFMAPFFASDLPSKSCIYDKKFKIINSEFDFEKCNFEIKDLENKLNTISILNNLQTKYDNVYIFNFEKFLCNKKKCNNFLKEKNLILFSDSSHLSTEAGIYLSKYFNHWLNINFSKEF